MKTTVTLFLLMLLMASCEIFYNPASVSSVYGGKEPENCPPDWDKYPSGVFQLIGVKDNPADDDEYDFTVCFGNLDYGVISVKKTTAMWNRLHVGNVVSLDKQGKYKKYPIHLIDVEKEREELRSYNVLEPDPALYKDGMTLKNTCPNWFHDTYTHSLINVTARIEGGRLEQLDDAEAFWSWILHVKGPTYENKRFVANHIEARKKKIHIGDIILIQFPYGSEGRVIVDNWGKHHDQIILPLADYNALLRDENGRLRRNEKGETMEEAYKNFSYLPWDFFPDVMYQEHWW